LNPQEVLEKYWGYPAFRPMQEEIISSLLDGKDVMAILPTGGGKSLCFQIPAMVREGVCLVITPLVALMQDQVSQLQARGIPAVSLHSGLGYAEIRTVLKETVEGRYKFLYVSPERLGTGQFTEALPHIKVTFIAIDEAHCISQWGYDFRPSYLSIAEVRKDFPRIPVIALTASATLDVQADILKRLRIEKGGVFKQSFDRPNLSYSAIRVDSRINKLREILQKVPGSAIVYCKTRKRTTEIASALASAQISANFYHAGLPQAERRERQERWIRNDIRVMACTNAFGMGIDKPDVRLVVHLAPPDCLENYYQEAGRAGRDGQKSYAVLLYHNRDIEELRAYPELRFPPMLVIRKVYEAMSNYLQVPSGLGQDQDFNIDLQDMVRKFRLSLAETHYALQALQQGGIITYQEQIFQPSTLQVTGSRADLEAVAETYPATDALLKHLLRSYEGILDQPSAISEKNIAWHLKKKIEEVQQSLSRLHQIGLVGYRPAKENPQVRYLQNRVATADLYIDAKAYMSRKSIYKNRVDAMIRYMLPGIECRAASIGKYFGSKTAARCGICDECIKRRKKKKESEEAFRILEQKAENALAEGPLFANELLEKLEPIQKERFVEMLNYWESEQRIQTGEDGRISLR
jgi:ATP-dependent DNA helicase RecQ